MIRATTPADAAAIATLVTEAFGQDGEARLVERLRATGQIVCELVSEEDGVIVGHIAFSPVRIGPESIGNDTGQGRWWGLAPLAVSTSLRRRGTGAELVRAGLDAARVAGVTLVVVLGEPEYYSRFGFAPAADLGLRCIYDVPSKYFMACRPLEAMLPAGTVHYDKAFDGL